jgi:hypothetical protein
VFLGEEREKFTIYNGPTNSFVCNKTLTEMSHAKTHKITPTCFDHQMIIIRELSDPGYFNQDQKFPDDDHHLMIETCRSDFKC